MAFDNNNPDGAQTRRLDGGACADGVVRGPGVDLGATDPNTVADPLAAPGPYDAFDPFDAPDVVDPYAPVDSFAGSGIGLGASRPDRAPQSARGQQASSPQQPARPQHVPWGGDCAPRQQQYQGPAAGDTAPQGVPCPDRTMVNPNARAAAPRTAYDQVAGDYYQRAASPAPSPLTPTPAPAPRADGQGGYDYNSLYEDAAAPARGAGAHAFARASRPARTDSPAALNARPRPRASALRWTVRLVCLGMLVFGIMVISNLTEQTVDQTSSLSSSAQQLANKGAYLVETGQSPTREQDPVKWFGERILLLSVKLSNHGVDIRHQAHTLQFALMGGVVALNVLAWMSGWAHRRSAFGHIRSWRSLLMFVLSLGACAAVSFTDQYHKLYVPGRHFDNLDLVFDAAGYIPAVVCVFVVWSVGSAVYRLVFRK